MELSTQSGNTLLKRLQEFQSKKSHLAGDLLALYSRGYWGSLGGDDGRGARGGCGNR